MWDGGCVYMSWWAWYIRTKKKELKIFWSWEQKKRNSNNDNKKKKFFFVVISDSPKKTLKIAREFESIKWVSFYLSIHLIPD